MKNRRNVCALLYTGISLNRFPLLGNWGKCFHPHYVLILPYLVRTYRSSSLETIYVIPGTWYYI